MKTAKYRATVKLRAASGKAKELEEFTIRYLPSIRQVEGLQGVEFSKDIHDEEVYILYYWWESPDASVNYTKGDLYAELMPPLKNLIVEHEHILSELLDGN